MKTSSHGGRGQTDRQGLHGGVTWGAPAADGGGGGKTGKPRGQGQLPRAGGPQASLLSERPVPLKDNFHGGRSPQEAELQTRGHAHLSRAAGTRSAVFPWMRGRSRWRWEHGGWSRWGQLRSGEAFPQPPNFQQQSGR